jgi:hypothetical protein
LREGFGNALRRGSGFGGGFGSIPLQLLQLFDTTFLGRDFAPQRGF